MKKKCGIKRERAVNNSTQNPMQKTRTREEQELLRGAQSERAIIPMSSV